MSMLWYVTGVYAMETGYMTNGNVRWISLKMLDHQTSLSWTFYVYSRVQSMEISFCFSLQTRLNNLQKQYWRV